MNNRSLRRILITALSSVVLMASGSAHAAFRTYLSVSGSDANPCTVSLPCRLLPAALAAADPGGEVWMLDSANFNSGPVDITKSVTILAIPGALGSVVALGGDAIIVNTAGVSVTLRNLIVRNFSSGGHGINFAQGTRVIVEGCEIYGLPLDGIHATAPNGFLTVKETTIRQNGGTGVHVSGSVNGTLSDSKVLYHGNHGVNVTDGAMAFILDSLISGAANMGVSATTNGGSLTTVVINNSVIKNVGNSAINVLANPGSPVHVTLSRSTISHVGTGINVQNGAGNPIVMLDNSVIVHTANSAVNLNNSGTAVVYTRNNNTINFNSGGLTVIGGTLTSRPTF